MKNSFLCIRPLLTLLFISILCTSASDILMATLAGPEACHGVHAQTCDLGTEDWTGSSNANPPSGWVRTGGSPNIGNVCSNCGEQNGLAIGFNAVGEAVVSPPLTCLGSVTFDWHASGNGSIFTVALQWSQTPDEEASWQSFETFSATAAGPAQKQYMSVTADLPEAMALAPFNIYVRFLMTDRTGGTSYIDNICFDSGTCTVTPTQLTFTQLPVTCIQVGSPFTVEVCATDVNGFVAEEFTEDIFLSATYNSNGNLTGDGTITASTGCATYTLTAAEEGGFTLFAMSSTLVSDEPGFTAIMTCPAEEFIKVMAYNILNFPNGRTPCDNAGDVVPPNRQDSLAKIIRYAAPDVLMVCELQTEEGSDAIIQAMKGVNPAYEAATFVPNTSSIVKSLNNMLYYNSAKMTLVGQDVTETNTRDISRYRMRINDPQIATAPDTVFINFYVAHLKAGSAAGDVDRRAEDVAIFQAAFDSAPLENAVMGGDMNFYQSSEAAYQTMLNGTNPWFDPAMAPGDWDNNFDFSDLHTQSSRAFTAPSYACGINGGIDSRFDFLLMNGPVNNESEYVEYLDGSYDVPGNNGDLFNRSINDPSNASGVPRSVLDALFFMSDHLPVVMDMKVTFPLQVLPVELLSFSAESTKDKTVNLNWATNEEIDFSHYAVERLAGRGDWQQIGEVEGGNTTYFFNDGAPATGPNYYRLRMVDVDGAFRYSPVRAVKINALLTVYPTVTTGDVFVNTATESGEILVADMLGREVWRGLPGANGRVSLVGLPSGWYVIGALNAGAMEGTARVFVR